MSGATLANAGSGTGISGRVQATFASGEIDEVFADRTDLKYRAAACGFAENVEFMPQGGFRLRHCLRHVGAVAASAARLVAFQSSLGQAYDVVLSAGLATVFDAVTETDTVVLPYSGSELAQVTGAQYLDTALLFHPDHAPQRLKHAGPSAWSADVPAFAGVPFYDYGGSYENGVAAVWDIEFWYNSPSLRWQVTVSGEKTVAFSTAAAGLDADDVAAIEVLLLDLPGVKPGISCALINSYTVRITFSGAGNEGDAWAISLTSLNEAASYGLAYKRTPGVEPGEAIMSAARGWPACGLFFDQSLVLGGLKSLGGTWLRSKIGDYFFLDDRGTSASDPFVVPMNTEGGETITRVIDDRYLVVLTTRAEYWISDRALSKGTPPNHVRASTVGSRPGVPIAQSEGAVLFVSRAGSSINELRYTEAEGNMQTGEISLLAAHLFADIVDMAMRKKEQAGDGNVLAVVERSGALRLGSLLRQQQVTGFARARASGLKARAVSVNARNELMMIGEDDGGARSLLRFERGLLLDRAVSGTLAPAGTTISGLAHLDGLTVWVLGDGHVIGPLVVTAGAVDLPFAVADWTVGTWTPPRVTTLPLSREVGPDIVAVKRARIHSVTLSLYDTTSVAIATNDGALRDVPLRRFGAAADVPELDTGFTGQVTIQGLRGFCDRPTVTISQLRPGRLTVRSVVIGIDL